ncbi:MAG: hypothetical protein ABSC30_06155 [Acidimicrobiales bacterium]|jgi:hypothetical protein
MMTARVHNFHVTAPQVGHVAQAVDLELARLRGHPNFRGLLFLERGDERREITAITLWEDSEHEETARLAEQARRHVAAVADFGVSTKLYSVLRFSAEAEVAEFMPCSVGSP